MASDKDKETEPKTAEPVEGSDPSLGGDPSLVADPSMVSDPSTNMVVDGDAGAGEGSDDPEAAAMGAQRYVHAAFLAAGILIAFIGGKLITLAWNNLADFPQAVRAVPQLVAYTEESRESISLTAGAVLGAFIAFRLYRRESVRRFADEVAAELMKVTWPNREAVVNGTVVVMVASAMATVYVAILDRFWGFLTTMVYGT
jgi:preprotein translocase subunit SecE